MHSPPGCTGLVKRRSQVIAGSCYFQHFGAHTIKRLEAGVSTSVEAHVVPKFSWESERHPAKRFGVKTRVLVTITCIIPHLQHCGKQVKSGR